MNKTSVLLVVSLATAGGSLLAGEKPDISKLDLTKLPPPAAAKGVTYAKDIRPLFEASCFRCHGEERQKGELRLDSLESVLKGGEDGKVVVPGDSKKSLLVVAVAQINEELAMPPKRGPGRGGPGGPGGPGRAGQPGGAGNRPPGGGPGGPGGPGGQGGPGGPGGRGPGGPGGGGFGPPPKPLTAEQVGLIRAWVDQGAK
jgi:hypothetical protein